MYNRVLEPFILAEIMITNDSVYGDILELYVFPKTDYFSLSSTTQQQPNPCHLTMPDLKNGWPEEQGRSRGDETASTWQY